MSKTVSPELGNLQKMIYRCADGKVRLFSGIQSRAIAYCWEVDPRSLALSNRRLVWDSRAIKGAYREAAGHVVDVYTLFPHAGGREQIVAFGFRPKALDYPYTSVIAGDAVKDAAGVYYAKIVYSRPISGAWNFAK